MEMAEKVGEWEMNNEAQSEYNVEDDIEWMLQMLTQDEDSINRNIYSSSSASKSQNAAKVFDTVDLKTSSSGISSQASSSIDCLHLSGVPILSNFSSFNLPYTSTASVSSSFVPASFSPCITEKLTVVDEAAAAAIELPVQQQQNLERVAYSCPIPSKEKNNVSVTPSPSPSTFTLPECTQPQPSSSSAPAFVLVPSQQIPVIYYPPLLLPNPVAPIIDGLEIFTIANASTFNESTGKFRCVKCPKEFCSRSGAFWGHFQSVHQNVRYYCSLCKKAFGRNAALTRHYKNIHKIPN